LQYSDVPEDIEPEEIRPMGNYAVSINWPDGFSQVNIHIRFNNFITKKYFFFDKFKKKALSCILLPFSNQLIFAGNQFPFLPFCYLSSGNEKSEILHLPFLPFHLSRFYTVYYLSNGRCKISKISCIGGVN
jgi:hypothetical protein